MSCKSNRAVTAVFPSKSAILKDHTARAVLICALLTIFLSACQSGYEKPPTISEGDSRQEETADNSNFEIRIASGGGATGLYSGYTLYSGGRVDHWNRFPGKEPTILWTSEEESGRIETLKDQLVQSGMIGKTHQETGNMTVTASYLAADSEIIWTWDADNAAELPAELERWYAAVKKFCDETGKKVNE